MKGDFNFLHCIVPGIFIFLMLTCVDFSNKLTDTVLCSCLLDIALKRLTGWF